MDEQINTLNEKQEHNRQKASRNKHHQKINSVALNEWLSEHGNLVHLGDQTSYQTVLHLCALNPTALILYCRDTWSMCIESCQFSSLNPICWCLDRFVLCKRDRDHVNSVEIGLPTLHMYACPMLGLCTRHLTRRVLMRTFLTEKSTNSQFKINF